MPRINRVNPATASGETKELLDGVRKKLGKVPNVIGGLANSPAAAKAYLSIGDALGKGLLSPALREQIALVVAEVNGCQYCLSAHSAIAKMVGVPEAQIAQSREAKAADPKTQAILTFTRKVVETRANISGDDLQSVRAAGVTDGEIAEIIANIAQNVLTNYFNHVAETDIDFPKVALTLEKSA